MGHCCPLLASAVSAAVKVAGASLQDCFPGAWPWFWASWQPGHKTTREMHVDCEQSPL